MMLRDRICRTVVAFGGIAFLLLWFLDPKFSEDEALQKLIRSILSRILGSIVFIALAFFLQYRLWSRFTPRHLLVLLPALLIAINNAPIIGLITGEVRIEHWNLLPLFVLECILIGTFEEFAFRGTLFLAILKKNRRTKSELIWTTVICSAFFGLVHFANLLEGAGLGATLLQVGYSFLIGAMCTIVLLKTGNLFYCILLHAIYDFGGGLMRTLGSGTLWDTPTVILTVILSVIVCVWMVTLLFRMDPKETDVFYDMKRRETAE